MGASTIPNSGTVSITDCTLSGNFATGGNGGTFSGGAGWGLGAGIFSVDGAVTLNDDTLAANTDTAGTASGGGAAGVADGGAVYNLAFGNLIQSGGTTTAALTLNNDILAQNTGGNDLASNNMAGNAANKATIGGGTNLVQSDDFTGTTVAAGVVTLNTNPNLGPLQNNGGQESTMALKTTSAAAGAGNPALPGVPAADQRGAPRLVNGLLDLGAFQIQAGIPAVSNVTATFSPNSQTITVSASVSAATSGSTTAPVNEGSVTFSVGGLSATAPVMNGSASTTLTLPGGLATGSYALAAAFADDPAKANFRSGTDPATLTVNPLATTVTITSVSTSFAGFGQRDVVTAFVTDANGNPVTEGQVTLTDGGKSKTVNVSNGIATATFKFSIFAGLGGAHSVNASYHDNVTGGFADALAALTAAGNPTAYLFQLELDLLILMAISRGGGAA
jgi:hypothetical protein